jgi:glycine cleavage system transcriptional repressor
MNQLIVTAVGADRPGIVGEFAGHVHALGGNLLDSRMVNLRGEFAMMILLECPSDACARLANELKQVGERIGLRVTVTEQQQREHTVRGLPYRLRTYSMDQPGIVARLTKVLQQNGVNIEELEARQESAAFAGGPLFLTEMRLTVPPAVGLAKLRQELEAVGSELNCDVDLDAAEG